MFRKAKLALNPIVPGLTASKVLAPSSHNLATKGWEMCQLLKLRVEGHHFLACLVGQNPATSLTPPLHGKVLAMKLLSTSCI